MRVITTAAYDTHVIKLFDRMNRLHAALSKVGIPYRIIGGMAVLLHVSERDPGKGRLTRDIDIAVERSKLKGIVAAAIPFGFQYRDAAGVDMHLDDAEPRASSGIHMVFAGEKVRPEYVEPVPGFSEPTRTAEGVLIAPVADLVCMKLTSFRLKDKVHIQDMDSVGLITPEIERGLSHTLRERLYEVRACE